MFVTALYKVYMISGHSTAQEIKHIESLPVVLLDLKPSVLREVSAFPPGPQSNLVPPCRPWLWGASKQRHGVLGAPRTQKVHQ